MKTHATNAKCPLCGETLSMTTEWGWIDDETCTAILCCASCRTLTAHADDCVEVIHTPRSPEEEEEDTERRALAMLPPSINPARDDDE